METKKDTIPANLESALKDAFGTVIENSIDLLYSDICHVIVARHYSDSREYKLLNNVLNLLNEQYQKSA